MITAVFYICTHIRVNQYDIVVLLSVNFTGLVLTKCGFCVTTHADSCAQYLI